MGEAGGSWYKTVDRREWLSFWTSTWKWENKQKTVLLMFVRLDIGIFGLGHEQCIVCFTYDGYQISNQIVLINNKWLVIYFFKIFLEAHVTLLNIILHFVY